MSNLVTVLMPVYNGGKYLPPSLRGVLSQTYKDFELLIVNDASTDDSLETIRSFRDPRIRIHTNPVNLGQTRSLNVGLKLAQGKYVARMDADDIAGPIWLETLLDYAKNHPEIAAIGSAATVIDQWGKKREIRRAPLTFQEIIFRLFFAPPMNHVSVLLNKDLILRNGGYDESFRITQDYELWSSLIRNKFVIANIPDILVSYRVHADSLGSMEANKRGLEEKSETIFRNIRTLTSLPLTKEEALQIGKLFYHPAELSPEQFEQAQRNFEAIYSHLREPLEISPSFLRRAVRDQMLKPYCKLAVSYLVKNRRREGRHLSIGYLKRYGFHLMPFLILLASFAGSGLPEKLPLLHRKWLGFITRISLLLKFAQRDL